MTQGGIIGTMPDLAFVRSWFARYGLAVWFATIFLMRLSVLVGGEIGFDARLYVAATKTWLMGGEPWIVIQNQQFAAPPPTLLLLVPFTALPPSVATAALIALAGFGVIATIRLLHLPWWWVLFPPFLDAVVNGNLQAVLVPLILAGAGPVAALLKIYAVVPLVLTLRWRAIVVTGALLAITAPILPWTSYVEHFADLLLALTNQSDGGLSSTAIPWLIPIAIVALIFSGRDKAAWLAVPALWPSTQWYYSTLAVPAVTAAPLAAALLAIPTPLATVAAAVVVAWQARLFSRARLREAWLPLGILGRP